MILVSQSPLANKANLVSHKWERYIGGKIALCIGTNPLGILFNEPFTSQDMIDSFVKMSKVKLRPQATIIHPKQWKLFTSGL